VRHNQPSVSVLMPVFNAEATIADAVSSILRQTYDDFELVIVDDGSNDAGPAAVESFREKRIRLIRAPHRGIIHALNLGIAECRAELIARMDADDISHPRRLEAQVSLMRSRPDVSVCSCLVRTFPSRAVLGGMRRYEQWLNSLVTHEQIARDIFVESPIAHPTAMLRKRELVEIGGYQERGWAEDYDLWLRYHAAGKRFAKVRQTLLMWRQTEGRITFVDSRYSVENFLRAKARYLAALLIGVDRPIVLWGAGKTGRRLSKHLMREGLGFEVVVDIDPNKIGHTLRQRPIVAPEYLANKKAFVIAAVSSHGARELIRNQLVKLGYLEGRDFICAA
jgi:glycosyltransferase involved in cell wall biosynthesis